jgi:hypothetical protein
MIVKKKSTQRCEGEGVNTFEENKMSLKPCFFKTTGPAKVRYFEQRVTINNKIFKSNCLFPLVAALNKQRPTLGMKNIKHYDNSRLLIQ